jgi:lipoprotein-anchoring transpeptidase ErfK/SrfK
MVRFASPGSRRRYAPPFVMRSIRYFGRNNAARNQPAAGRSWHGGPGPAVRRVVPVLAVVTAAGLGACSSSTNSGGSSNVPAAAPTTVPRPSITVTPADGAAGVALTNPVVVRSNAPLAAVSVAREASAAQKTEAGVLVGQFSADRKTWTSTGGLFADTRYQVDARTSPATGLVGTTSVHSIFVTQNPEKSFKVSWDPVDGQTVGVGTPINLTFSAAAADRAAVERRLSVRTEPAVEGSWHWVTGRLIMWRPHEYWQPGTKVHVEANLAGYDAGGGRVGVKDRSMDFVVGPAQISYVDANSHTMRVYRNGVLQRTMAVSLGRPQYPSMGGPHNVLGKAQKVVMDSATVGIPKGNPDYYYEDVFWNVQYTSGGEYVHAAPWSVGSQGRTNVSHGCVNASPQDAEWFYNFTRFGDIVDIKNTGRAPDTSEAGNVWSVPWSTWKAGSALPAGASSGVAGERPRRDGESHGDERQLTNGN